MSFERKYLSQLCCAMEAMEGCVVLDLIGFDQLINKKKILRRVIIVITI